MGKSIKKSIVPVTLIFIIYICRLKIFMKNRGVLLSIITVMLTGCFKPWFNYEEYPVPKPPDYANDAYWACLPWKHNASDTVPPGSGLIDEQTDAKVDVFFIYPTLDLRTDEWNASVDDNLLNKVIDKTSIRAQASVFNGSCRIFAPRYRQAVFASFLDKDGNGTKALALAYSDVEAAFKYYMQHYNKGRPVIIAGHSQGCLHAYKLVKEFFDTSALKQQLVAAYLVGFKINKDSIKNIKPCDSAKETGCYVTWNTVTENGLSGKASNYFSGVCVNPLNWKQDSTYIDAVYNMGSVDYKFGGIDNHEAGAACRNGLLVVKISDHNKYVPLFNSYHLYDYNLFYMNIRANVADRVNAYLKLHSDYLRK